MALLFLRFIDIPVLDCFVFALWLFEETIMVAVLVQFHCYYFNFFIFDFDVCYFRSLSLLVVWVSSISFVIYCNHNNFFHSIGFWFETNNFWNQFLLNHYVKLYHIWKVLADFQPGKSSNVFFSNFLLDLMLTDFSVYVCLFFKISFACFLQCLIVLDLIFEVSISWHFSFIICDLWFCCYVFM